MAKNKKKPQPQQKAKISPQRFMREKARNYPIGKCYWIPGWEEDGLTTVIVARERTNGNLAFAAFNVDTFCLGVKNVLYDSDITPEDFEGIIRQYSEMGMEETTYNQAHNIIYGAIAFAEEAGIEPCKDFDTAAGILEEDTDDVPLIEFNFGKKGKHCLIIGEEGREKQYLPLLHKNLGPGNFDYIMALGGGEEYDSSDTPDADEIMGEYTYEYPEYPQTLSVKHQFIADEMLSPDNFFELHKEVIDKVLALPTDEAVADISTVALYVIGSTHKQITDGTIDDPDNSPIIHALALLTLLGSEKGLDTVLEIMRQDALFFNYHLGGEAALIFCPLALCACGNNRLDAIFDFISKPNFFPLFQGLALNALKKIALVYPGHRAEIIEYYRAMLKSLNGLPEPSPRNVFLVSFVISCLADSRATEATPEIEDFYNTAYADSDLFPDYGKVKEIIREPISDTPMPDIYEQYRDLKAITETDD